jgi:hypothetical protein
MALTSGDTLRITGTHVAARDLLRADGAEGKVAGFGRTATLDTALRANAVQEGVLRG